VEVPTPAHCNPFTLAAAGGVQTKREGGAGTAGDSVAVTGTSRAKREQPTALTVGDYHLPDDPGALLRYEPGALRCSHAQVQG